MNFFMKNSLVTLIIHKFVHKIRFFMNHFMKNLLLVLSLMLCLFAKAQTFYEVSFNNPENSDDEWVGLMIYYDDQNCKVRLINNEALNEKTAYMMLHLMKGVVQSGTGTRLNYKYHLSEYSAAIAGKTGTTQNNSDCWFVGITPKLATAIWTGGELRSIHFRNMTYGQGASMALPIFGYYMQSIYKDPKLHFPRGDFEQPSVPLDVELDCARFQEEIMNEIDDRETWDF